MQFHYFILQIFHQLMYFLLNPLQNVHVKKAPSNIYELFSYVDEHHYYNTRASSNMNMYCQLSRLSIQYNSFSRFGVSLCNSIPQNTKSLSKKDFKKKIKMQLLQHLTKNKSYKEPEKLINALPWHLRPFFHFFFIWYSLFLYIILSPSFQNTIINPRSLEGGGGG